MWQQTAARRRVGGFVVVVATDDQHIHAARVRGARLARGAEAPAEPGADPNEHEDGLSVGALGYAIAADRPMRTRLAMVRELINAGAHAWTNDESGYSPLLLACQLGDSAGVVQIIHLLGDPYLDVVCDEGSPYDNPISLAAHEGNFRAMRTMLEMRAAPDHPEAGWNPDGLEDTKRPLTIAAARGNVKVAILLAVCGAPRDNGEEEAAAENGHRALARWLAQTREGDERPAGARSRAFARSPLHYLDPPLVPPQIALDFIRGESWISRRTYTKHGPRRQDPCHVIINEECPSGEWKDYSPLEVADALDEDGRAPRGSAAWYVLRAAEPRWSEDNHATFPLRRREHAAFLIKTMYQIVYATPRLWMPNEAHTIIELFKSQVMPRLIHRPSGR